MGETQLNITGARRHIDYKIVQRRPFGIIENLIKRRNHHGRTPNYGGFFIDQETHRVAFHAVGHQGQHHPLVFNLRPRACRDSHDERKTGPVDVRVEQAYSEALLLQRDRQIGCGGGFPNPTLTRGDADDVLDLF